MFLTPSWTSTEELSSLAGASSRISLSLRTCFSSAMAAEGSLWDMTLVGARVLRCGEYV